MHLVTANKNTVTTVVSLKQQYLNAPFAHQDKNLDWILSLPHIFTQLCKKGFKYAYFGQSLWHISNPQRNVLTCYSSPLLCVSQILHSWFVFIFEVVFIFEIVLSFNIVLILNNSFQRGSSSVNMLSNSKMSEFDPRWGSPFFKYFWNSKILNYLVGRGVRPNWEFFSICIFVS